MKIKTNQQETENGTKAVAYLITGLSTLIGLIAMVAYHMNGTL